MVSWRTEDNESVDMGKALIISETNSAILAKLESKEEIWIPKSVVHDDSEVSSLDDEGVLIVKHWWAEKNGWA